MHQICRGRSAEWLDGTEYEPTKATGKELEDRKKGPFKRKKAGDDDDAY